MSDQIAISAGVDATSPTDTLLLFFTLELKSRLPFYPDFFFAFQLLIIDRSDYVSKVNLAITVSGYHYCHSCNEISERN